MKIEDYHGASLNRGGGGMQMHIHHVKTHNVEMNELRRRLEDCNASGFKLAAEALEKELERKEAWLRKERIRNREIERARNLRR